MAAISAQENILKVTALSSGTVLLNGQPTNISVLEDAFKKAKIEGGTVWYYRENSETTSPPPHAQAVMSMVIKYELQVSLSTKSDFSDYLNEDGTSVPRKSK